MYQIDSVGSVPVMPAIKTSTRDPSFFSDGDPALGQNATVVDADFLNMIQNELVNVVKAASLTLDKQNHTQLLQAMRFLFGASNPFLYVGKISFDMISEPLPQTAEANGAEILDADVNTPKLYEALQTDPRLIPLLKTEEEWQAIKADDAIWRGNMGACANFVLDTTRKTIRLPDLRGLAAVGRGFDGLESGGVHGDMIRNIIGSISENGGFTYQSSGVDFTGAFRASHDTNNAPATVNSSPRSNLYFDASRVVPTGSANWMRSFGGLWLVYLG